MNSKKKGDAPQEQNIAQVNNHGLRGKAYRRTTCCQALSSIVLIIAFDIGSFAGWRNV
jgi:hypothetical protein